MTLTSIVHLLNCRVCSKECVNIESCDTGDIVLVVWNESLHRYNIAQVCSVTYNNIGKKFNLLNKTWYVLVQESQYLHFLAEESHTVFNLPVPNSRDMVFENIQKPLFFRGVVAEKQYCMVKKEGTRYRVPVGTKFCRIKVNPLQSSRRISSYMHSEGRISFLQFTH